MLYDEIVTVCRPYLGLATEAFINRQLFGNMKLKKLEQLKVEHLKILAKWCYHSSIDVMGKEKAKEMALKIIDFAEKYQLQQLFRPPEA